MTTPTLLLPSFAWEIEDPNGLDESEILWTVDDLLEGGDPGDGGGILFGAWSAAGTVTDLTFGSWSGTSAEHEVDEGDWV